MPRTIITTKNTETVPFNNIQFVPIDPTPCFHNDSNRSTNLLANLRRTLAAGSATIVHCTWKKQGQGVRSNRIKTQFQSFRSIMILITGHREMIASVSFTTAWFNTYIMIFPPFPFFLSDRPFVGRHSHEGCTLTGEPHWQSA